MLVKMLRKYLPGENTIVALGESLSSQNMFSEANFSV